MQRVGYMLVNCVATLLRIIPLRCRTGLFALGTPDRTSPVLVTGNYRLTVARVKKALQGVDAYLLVAESRGINVWCAATGGLFTHHDIISVLKTSGIEELVDHRHLILPQLAATGIDTGAICRKTGWWATWGPVYAHDLPRFIANAMHKTSPMSGVLFSLSQRLEMAVAWAFPMSLIMGLITAFLWREALVPLIVLIWGIAGMTFVLFPWYAPWLRPRRRGSAVGRHAILFDIGRGPVMLWLVGMAGLAGVAACVGTLTWGMLCRWGAVSFMVLLTVSIDIRGSTPVHKSGLHTDRLLAITLDTEKCKGAGVCEDVCPRNCHHVDTARHIASLPHADRCVQCGACIVQCPFDALYFTGPGGVVVAHPTTSDGGPG